MRRRGQPWHGDAKSARPDSHDRVRSAGRRIAEVVNGPNLLSSLVCCHYSGEDEDGVLYSTSFGGSAEEASLADGGRIGRNLSTLNITANKFMMETGLS